MQWDIFCRVVDNFGDIGVCWRLAVDLAARADDVRLWTDDASCPRLDGTARRRGRRSARLAGGRRRDHDASRVRDRSLRLSPARGISREHGDARRAARLDQPRVSERGRPGRAQPRIAPRRRRVGRRADLPKWFFYPGFTPRTGGLMREADLANRQAMFDATAWRRSNDISRRRASVARACSAIPIRRCLPCWTDLSASPTLLLVTAGLAARQVRQLCGTDDHPGGAQAAVPAGTFAGRLRPSAVVMRPEPGARRRFLRTRPMGCQTLPLADLSAGRRRARREAGGVSSPLPGTGLRSALGGLRRGLVALERAGRPAAPVVLPPADLGTIGARTASGGVPD